MQVKQYIVNTQQNYSFEIINFGLNVAEPTFGALLPLTAHLSHSLGVFLVFCWLLRDPTHRFEIPQLQKFTSGSVIFFFFEATIPLQLCCLPLHTTLYPRKMQEHLTARWQPKIWPPLAGREFAKGSGRTGLWCSPGTAALPWEGQDHPWWLCLLRLRDPAQTSRSHLGRWEPSLGLGPILCASTGRALLYIM